MSDSKENVDVLKMYGEDSTTQRDEFLKKHNLNEKGLTSKQAEINIKKFGLNETKKAKPKKWYNYLLQSLLTPFNCILIGISIILIYTDIYLSGTGSEPRRHVIAFDIYGGGADGTQWCTTVTKELVINGDMYEDAGTTSTY